MTQLITLCADDFAHSRGTSEIIARLALDRRINGVSCMSVMPGWRQDATLLHALPSTCEIGLHITLTNECPLDTMVHYAPEGRMPTANALLRLTHIGRLPRDEIAAEIARQFTAFVDSFGRPPDFVDAHQHVHHLRVIRRIVLEQTAFRAPSAWVRSCSDKWAALLTRPFSGKAIGSAWHSRGFSRLAAKYGLATNLSFAGHYDFSERFETLFPRFFDYASDHHVVMTHPGAADRADDPIGAARVREAAFLECFSLPTELGRRTIVVQ